MKHRIAAAALCAALGTLGLAAAATSASATATTSTARSASFTSCRYGNYHAKSVLLSAHKRALVTHRLGFTAPPGYSRTTTKSVREQTSLSSAAKLGSEVSASIGDPLIGSASAKLSVSLARTRHHTTTRAVSISETVRNNGRHNATFIFYRGH